jgi:hypothetical protein
MRPMNMKNATSKTQLFLALVIAVSLLVAPAAFAAAPGITSTTGGAGTFNLTAQDSYINQPDGNAVYSWGYGCASAPPAAAFVPNAPFAFTPTCNTMQVPGPTMVVTEGQPVTISLTNNLPTAAGNTSILFPGFVLTSTCPNTAANPQGLLACEAAPGATVTYSFLATAAGTHAYYSGTQGDLQVEMGLYGAIIVLPSTPPTNCANGNTVTNLYGKTDYGTTARIPGFPEHDFRLSTAAYDHPKSCYDREYLFQWAEMDTRIHQQAMAEVQAKTAICSSYVTGSGNLPMGCSLDVQTEPYHPEYFLINGRSMPDDMDPNYASEYPHQPYNGNPHMHPGELTLIRTVGQGRWQHPFHEHANHVRILARDGNLILSPTNPTSSLAGSLVFNTDTTPGEAFDGIFYFSGRGLNWDPYGHHPAGTNSGSTPLAINAISESGNTVTVTVSGTQLPANGGQVVISGVSNPAFNGSFTVASTTGATTLAITNLTESSTTVTATVTGALPASIKAGTSVIISGASVAGFNGTFTLTAATSGTTTSTIRYTAASGLGSPGAQTAAGVTANQSSFTYIDPTSGLGSLVGGTATATVTLNSSAAPSDPLANLPCTPDANGYNTGNPAALNYYEWCQDHNKPVQVAPFGDVASGGPATLPDPNVFTNGQWYGGSPYLGPDATLRGSHGACDTTTNANCTDLLPSNTEANPANERGWAFMWHSHNEREITTNNVFPGGMLMMMLVDSREFPIDESN